MGLKLQKAIHLLGEPLRLSTSTSQSKRPGTMYINNCKVKLSLYAQWRHSRRTEGVGPTHSSPRHQMGVSGESHAPAVFYSWTKALGSRWLGVWVGHTAGLGAEARERFLGSKPNRERIIITSNFSFYGLWILIRNLPCRAVR